jgi:hypothetical protein
VIDYLPRPDEVENVALDQDDAEATLDEGRLHFSLPHSILCGKSI